jgi:hypothetical protein
MTWALLEEPIPPEYRPYLSIATRQSFDQGKTLTLNIINWKEFADAEREVSVSAKLERILRFIGEKAKVPGGIFSVNNLGLDSPLLWAINSAELTTYLKYLQDEGLITGPSGPLTGGAGNYTPTIKGWQRLEPMLHAGGEPDRCFVAMWFADELDPVYETGFAKAIEQCGFRCYRVKEDPTNKAVIDTILAEIRRAHFVVADFTGNRQSVYYEAGFARGIGREVIGCCREGETRGLAFDTRHLGHVVWKDSADLQEKLMNSIQANILPKR